MAVLGTIFLGIASPTEAASAGAVGSLVVAAINRRLTWSVLKGAVHTTFRATCMIMWILVGAYAFKAVFIGTGGPGLAQSFLGGLDVAPIIVVMMMQVTYLFLGCFLDDIVQMVITIPIYLPILTSLGFDPVWFGVLFLINMQLGYLTPPFGVCLFYLKGVAPPQISMADIYRSVGPFLPLQFTVLMLVLFFPQLALWLPNLVFG
jgi:tripartite ATP-independent transporter DctM subunit